MRCFGPLSELRVTDSADAHAMCCTAWLTGWVYYQTYFQQCSYAGIVASVGPCSEQRASCGMDPEVWCHTGLPPAASLQWRTCIPTTSGKCPQGRRLYLCLVASTRCKLVLESCRLLVSRATHTFGRTRQIAHHPAKQVHVPACKYVHRAICCLCFT